MDKYIGKRLDGRYEIHELIGVGGMANVYRCTDTLDDREVAIKILKDEFLNNEEFIRRFKNESKAIAMLSHPNIVKVYDVSFGDMIQYIVMEYIDGITLKEYIAQQGIIEWKDVLHLTIQVLRALQHAHECGIVHRDIKPQNIMLLQDGTIKVTDFGIARFSDKATRTMTDQAIGSVHYIAPEQARGDSTDGKTDIYSVGVMLYEMLTGTLPFDGDSAVTVALMQLQSTPKRPREVNPSIPAGLEQITMHAMEKQPENRYTSAAEMLSDIERFRLNPSIVFDYNNSFVDNQPTKHMDDLKKKEPKRLKDDTKADQNDTPDDDSYVKEHSPVFHAVKGVLIAALVVCAVFFAIAAVRGFTSSQSKDVDVPNLVGKTLVAAKENNPDNFQFEIKSKFDESQEIGVILAQDPEPGSMKIKTGSKIELTVNGTDTEAQIPFVVSYTEKQAVEAIKDKNFVPQVVYVENTKTKKDYTIDTFPTAGVKSTIGSTVYVYIAKGSRTENVTIPGVLGKTLDEARGELENLGLTVETVMDDESKEPENTVLCSSPLPYGKVEKGTVVTLTVSSGVGDKHKVDLVVDLPSAVTDTLNMTVTVDGVVDSEQSKQVVPSITGSVTVSLEGHGTSTVVISLNDQTYREYTVDFSKGEITNTVVHEYVVPTTAVPTEPVTEPVTEAPYVPPTDYEVPTDAPVTYYDPNIVPEY
ncbi:MAG: Stk1 family PASTA domain-containing Ser/Thr kinase [Ruminococcus sp.]|nr:Stk1 family PASTA domain-containing Ser/Thr kinase [Ruminococcus sp.]